MAAFAWVVLHPIPTSAVRSFSYVAGSVPLAAGTDASGSRGFEAIETAGSLVTPCVSLRISLTMNRRSDLRNSFLVGLPQTQAAKQVGVHRAGSHLIAPYGRSSFSVHQMNST